MIEMKKISPKYLITLSLLYGIIVVLFGIQAVFSNLAFVRLISVVLITFISGVVGAFIRQLFILKEK